MSTPSDHTKDAPHWARSPSSKAKDVSAFFCLKGCAWLVVDRTRGPHPQKMPTSESPEPVPVSLHGKGDFTGVIKSRILRWGEYLGLTRPDITTRDLSRESRKQKTPRQSGGLGERLAGRCGLGR